MPFAEDLAPFFSVAEFASAATLDGAAVKGIFDQPYAPATVGPFGMAASVPTYTLPTASVPAQPIGKVLAIGASVYSVVEHQPDGTGISVLHLELSGT